MKGFSAKTWIVVVALTVVISSLTAISCRDSEISAPRTSVRIKLRPEVSQRYARAHEQYSWVADMHAQGLAEAITARKGWDTNSPDYRVRNCSLARRIGIKYAATARRNVGMQSDPKGDSALVDQAQTALGCSFQPQMSIFARPQSSFALRATMSDEMDNFMHFSGWMTMAAYKSDNTWLGIQGALLLKLDAAADSVDQYDFDLLSAQVDYTLSSAETWYDYQQSGGFGPEEVVPMSVFHMYMIPFAPGPCGPSCRKFYRNDALGFGAGAATAGKWNLAAALYSGIIWGLESSLTSQ